MPGRNKEKKPGEPAPAELPKVDELLKKLEGVGKAVQLGAKRTVGVRGTFNAAAIRALAAGGPTERIAKSNEEIAKHCKKLVQEAEDGGLVFA